MSAERTKTLWISAAVAAFALVVALAGVFLFAPTRSGTAAPASAGNTAAPKATDPQDYLSAPPPLAMSAEPRQGDGDIIVIYGDKPAELPSASASSPGAALAAPAENPVAAPASAPKPTPKPAPSPATSPKASSSPLATSSPKATTTSAAKPATVKLSQYWVQTGSFKRSDLAENMKRELGDRGLASHIFVQEINGETWRRIRVGPYATKAEAEGWLPKIKAVPGCEEAIVYKSAVEAKK